MHHPRLAVIVFASALSAGANELPGPEPLVLRPPLAPAHTPSPFPEDDDLKFQGDGPNGWAIAGGTLAACATLSGLIAAGSHARLKGPDLSPTEERTARATRNQSGYTAIGCAGLGTTAFLISFTR